VSAQAVNVAAVAWAYGQVDLPSPIAKLILLVYAIHANGRGYTWPSTELVASIGCTDRGTVRRQIRTLLVRRLLSHTKKRFGSTGQVRVYRLPKITWESDAHSTALKGGQTGAKAVRKRCKSGTQSTTNKEHMNKEQRKHHHVLSTSCNSIAEGQRTRDDDVSLVGKGIKSSPLMAEISELTKSENSSEDFRRCWERRIKENPSAVAQAIRVTRSMVHEDKIKRSIGGALDSNYRLAIGGRLNSNYERALARQSPEEQKRAKLRREMEEARRRLDESRKNGSEN
jgi:hypothetical protein